MYYGTRGSGVPNYAAGTQKNNDFNYNYILKSICNKGYITIVVEARMESVGSCWRSIYNFRPKTDSWMKRQNQPIRSSEKVGEELMKHGYVVGRIGVDGTRKGLIELSKVVFHNIFLLTLWGKL